MSSTLLKASAHISSSHAVFSCSKRVSRNRLRLSGWVMSRCSRYLQEQGGRVVVVVAMRGAQGSCRALGGGCNGRIHFIRPAMAVTALPKVVAKSSTQRLRRTTFQDTHSLPKPTWPPLAHRSRSYTHTAVCNTWHDSLVDVGQVLPQDVTQPPELSVALVGQAEAKGLARGHGVPDRGEGREGKARVEEA